MDVAACCGLADAGSALMEDARAAWRRWCQQDRELAVVDELDELRAWTLDATAVKKNALLAKVAALTRDDPSAVTALVWLLLPGAAALADELRDLAPDIDGLVPGQLWIEAADAYRPNGRRVASAVLRQTRREVCAELGVGDAAMRRDRVWAQAVRVDHFDESIPAPDDQDMDPLPEMLALFVEAEGLGAINGFDFMLLDELAKKAHELGAPTHRGRMGLTSPAVVEAFAAPLHLSARALRRRAAKAIDRIAEYVGVRGDPERLAVWRARHRRPAVLSAAEQTQLALAEAEFYPWIKDLAPEYSVRAPDADEDPRSAGSA